MSALPTCVNDASADLQSRFISVLPRIKDQARFYFRSIKCVVHRAECIAETIGVAWKWFCRLAKKGKDATKFASALARLAARAVRAGRRVGAGETANDVMSSVAQRRHNFKIEPLPSPRTGYDNLLSSPTGQRDQDVLEERLRDNTRTPPPEQAAFRVDFSRWLKTLTPRKRRIIRAMSLNEKTKNLSRVFKLSPGRISQMRREFHDDWSRFVGDVEEKMPA
jgi:hypothetical protein